MSQNDYLWTAYTALAALAGAITALFYRPYENMTRTQIVFSVFVGFAFAFFVGPLLFRNLSDMRVAGGLFYLLATGSNALIPWAVKKLPLLLSNGGGEKP